MELRIDAYPRVKAYGIYNFILWAGSALASPANRAKIIFRAKGGRDGNRTIAPRVGCLRGDLGAGPRRVAVFWSSLAHENPARPQGRSR